MYKAFGFPVIASVVTGRCLIPGSDFDQLYELLGYMTGDEPYTHQLPRFMEECKPHILDQYPMLRELNFDVVSEKWREWLSENQEKYGSRFLIKPMHEEDHIKLDPQLEAETMIKPEKIIIVELGSQKSGKN